MCVALWNALLIVVLKTMPFFSLEQRVVNVVVDHLALVAAVWCSLQLQSSWKHCPKNVTWAFTWAHGRKLNCLFQNLQVYPKKSPAKFISPAGFIRIPSSSKCLRDKWTRLRFFCLLCALFCESHQYSLHFYALNLRFVKRVACCRCVAPESVGWVSMCSLVREEITINAWSGRYYLL